MSFIWKVLTSCTALQLDAASLKVPDGVPIYDLQTDIPWFFDAKAPWADLVQRTLETEPDLVKQLLAPERPKPHPEAKSILRWETNMVRLRINYVLWTRYRGQNAHVAGTACCTLQASSALTRCERGVSLSHWHALSHMFKPSQVCAVRTIE